MDISLYFPLLLLGLLAGACCETCPPAEDIAPCTCGPSILRGRIDIECNKVSLKDIDDVFDNLRGKTIDDVTIRNVKGDRLSSHLFWNTHVRWITITDCDIRGLSDSDRRPPFLGLEDSLEHLEISNSIKGDNQLKTLDLSHLKKLDYLWVSLNNITEVGNDWFAKGPLSLKTVTIGYGEVSKFGDSAFAPLVNLQSLRLYGNRLTSLKRSMLPNPASHLQIVDLDYNSLTGLQNDIFSGMPALKSVYLKINLIKRIEEKTWSSVWEKLDNLYLEENPLECDSHMNWTFSIKSPKELYGTCDSPATKKGQSLLSFIDDNRKLLSLTKKSSGSSSKN